MNNDNIYGKSTQDGIPTPEKPIEIISKNIQDKLNNMKDNEIKLTQKEYEYLKKIISNNIEQEDWKAIDLLSSVKIIVEEYQSVKMNAEDFMNEWNEKCSDEEAIENKNKLFVDCLYSVMKNDYNEYLEIVKYHEKNYKCKIQYDEDKKAFIFNKTEKEN